MQPRLPEVRWIPLASALIAVLALSAIVPLTGLSVGGVSAVAVPLVAALGLAVAALACTLRWDHRPAPSTGTVFAAGGFDPRGPVRQDHPDAAGHPRPRAPGRPHSS